jgi:hypothetical protein
LLVLVQVQQRREDQRQRQQVDEQYIAQQARDAGFLGQS